MINLAENSNILREIFKNFEKKLQDFEKNSRLLKKTQCYGVGLTQSVSIKSVKKKAWIKCSPGKLMIL